MSTVIAAVWLFLKIYVGTVAVTSTLLVIWVFSAPDIPDDDYYPPPTDFDGGKK